jgi:hypothetical protein
LKKTSYPGTRYQPAEIPDYSSIVVRRRLSGPTLRHFFKIMQKWKVDAKDIRLLLGGISTRRFRQLSIRPEGRILNQDQLLRVTSLIAIDQALKELLPWQQADNWARTPDMRLRGGTPLHNLIRGGTVTLWEWRQSLERQVSESQETD